MIHPASAGEEAHGAVSYVLYPFDRARTTVGKSSKDQRRSYPKGEGGVGGVNLL